MAMNGKTLGDAIADLIISPKAPADVKLKIKAQWEAIGAVIVSHIQENAQVTVAAGIAVSTTGAMGPSTGATTATGSGTVQ